MHGAITMLRGLSCTGSYFEHVTKEILDPRRDYNKKLKERETILNLAKWTMVLSMLGAVLEMRVTELMDQRAQHEADLKVYEEELKRREEEQRVHDETMKRHRLENRITDLEAENRRRVDLEAARAQLAEREHLVAAREEAILDAHRAQLAQQHKSIDHDSAVES